MALGEPRWLGRELQVEKAVSDKGMAKPAGTLWAGGRVGRSGQVVEGLACQGQGWEASSQNGRETSDKTTGWQMSDER